MLNHKVYIIYLASSHHGGNLSSHNIIRSSMTYNTVRDLEREHIHIAFITVYCCNFSILLLLLLSPYYA